jgi:hypothetical protein
MAVVEVGMAYGTSTIAILSALRDNGDKGKLISIDPSQSTDWESVGLANVQRAQLSHLHELLEEVDYIALPRLFARGLRIQLGYIDGWHTFDYVALDSFYLDKLLDVRGILGYNDCGWPSVHKAIKYFTRHRRYVELDVGLSRTYEGHNVMSRLWARTRGRSAEDRYFRKEEQWEPNWNFYSSF